MPIRQRKPNEITQQVVPLLLLGMGLVTANSIVTFIAEESATLSLATRPVREMLAQLLSGRPALGLHPPLFDILLHFWLRWTGGMFDYLRIPSILFFLAGLFLLGRAGRHFAGAAGGTAIVWMGVLWPFGFHYGRIAAWYVFSFFLVSGLTLAYLKYLEGPGAARWTILFLFCLALLWTTYFGCIVLACLAVDLMLRHRDPEFPGKLKSLLGTAALLLLACLPLWLLLRIAFGSEVNVHQPPLAILANAVSGIVSLFTSESVAPWYWRLSVPAGLAVLFCLVLAARRVPRPVRRFLIYSASSIAVLALLGILDAKVLFLLSPWILMPVGVAIAETKPRWETAGLIVALIVIGAAGWYGIYTRRYYSAPQFIEPWQEVAGDTAGKIRGGATVISDQPSFLFYLTYFLHLPRQDGPWRFEGSLPEFVKSPQVFSPEGWLAAGHPASGKMILVRGGSEPGGSAPIDDAARQLDRFCGSISSRLRMRDEGYAWKQRFSPRSVGPQWRIEIREYDCDSSNSKQIYHIPPR